MNAIEQYINTLTTEQKDNALAILIEMAVDNEDFRFDDDGQLYHTHSGDRLIEST